MNPSSVASTDQAVHPVDEKLPTGRMTALGLQHVLVMYAGAVAVPLIVGRARTPFSYTPLTLRTNTNG